MTDQKLNIQVDGSAIADPLKTKNDIARGALMPNGTMAKCTERTQFHFNYFRTHPEIWAGSLTASYPSILTMTVEEASEQADYVTKQMFTEPTNIWDEFCYVSYNYDINESIVKRINATGFANASFVYLHANDTYKKLITEKYLLLRELLKKYYQIT